MVSARPLLVLLGIILGKHNSSSKINKAVRGLLFQVDSPLSLAKTEIRTCSSHLILVLHLGYRLTAVDPCQTLSKIPVIRQNRNTTSWTLIVHASLHNMTIDCRDRRHTIDILQPSREAMVK